MTNPVDSSLLSFQLMKQLSQVIEKDEALWNLAIKHAKDAFYKIKKFYPKYARNLTAKG